MKDLQDHNTPYVKNRRTVFGFIAVAFGLLLLASNFDIVSYNMRHILFSWQMILIIIGIVQVMNHKEKPTGYILLAIGGFFLLPDVFNFPFNFMRLFWPVLLIIVGLSFIFFHRSRNYSSSGHSTRFDEDLNGPAFLDEITVFGGTKRRVANKEFKGGRLTTIFGGAEIDLTQALLTKGTNVLEITCIFGGTSLIVPSDWTVHVDVVSVFGAFEDKRTYIKKTETSEGSLVIKGVAIFGGGDIKSY